MDYNFIKDIDILWPPDFIGNIGILKYRRYSPMYPRGCGSTGVIGNF